MGGTLSGNTTQPAVNTTQPAVNTTQPSAYDMSASAYRGALGATGAAMSGEGVQRAMNPYIREVTQRTLGDLERQRQMQSMTTAAQAQKAGAFGGSRHGVADSLTNEAFARQAADTAANLNMQGYNTAQSALMQGAAQLGSLSNLGFGFGQKIAEQQSGQGALQQALIQQLINAAQAQYSGFTGAPNAAIQLPLAAAGAGNMGQQTTTESKQPGLLDWAALAATAFGGL